MAAARAAAAAAGPVAGAPRGGLGQEAFPAVAGPCGPGDRGGAAARHPPARRRPRRRPRRAGAGDAGGGRRTTVGAGADVLRRRASAARPGATRTRTTRCASAPGCSSRRRAGRSARWTSPTGAARPWPARSSRRAASEDEDGAGRGLRLRPYRPVTLEDAGFTPQPARTYAVVVSPDLTAADGQVARLRLGGHRRALAPPDVRQLRRRPRRLGGGRRTGPAVPCPQPPHRDAVAAAARGRRADADAARAVRAVLRHQPARPRRAPRAHACGPTSSQSVGLDLKPALPASGRGIVWAALREGAPIPRARQADEAARPRERRPGHEPRDHREGQPAEHAGDGDAPRRRRAGGGGLGLDPRPSTTPSSGRAPPTPTASPSRRTRALRDPERGVGVPLRRHRGEGRRRRLRGQRLERGHRAVDVRETRSTSARRAAAARDGLRRPRRLPARRGGPLQGDPARRHAGGHRAAAAGNGGAVVAEGQPGQRNRQADGRAQRLEQRGVDGHAAARRRRSGDYEVSAAVAGPPRSRRPAASSSPPTAARTSAWTSSWPASRRWPASASTAWWRAGISSAGRWGPAGALDVREAAALRRAAPGGRPRSRPSAGR